MGQLVNHDDEDDLGLDEVGSPLNLGSCRRCGTPVVVLSAALPDDGVICDRCAADQSDGAEESRQG